MFITAGNDFSLRYVVTEATYAQDETIWVDVDLTQCSNIQVFLDCEEHNIHIPLDWSLEENTNNVIIANVVASTLHVGTTYGTTVTGLDANGKSFRWNCDGSDFISIVEDTNDMNLEGPTELDDIHVKIGLVSPQGPQGAQGTAGRDGVDGVQGAQGNIGNQGEQGNQGEMGYQGDKGDRGITGAQGDMGQQGMKGEQGPQGDKGDKGERGITGFQGDAGAQGNRGNQGEQGDQGTQGNQGNAGLGFGLTDDNQFYVDNHIHIRSSDGIFFEGSYDSNGKPVRAGSIWFNSMTSPNPEIFINGEYSVDELYGTQGGNIFANDYIYVTPSGSPHSIRYKLESIKKRINELENDFGHQGPQGDKGEDGYRGRDGVQGAQGDQGEMGYQGNKGDRGADGYQGEMGQQGRKGDQGEMGYQGVKGDRGFIGYQGDMGQQGAKGYQGDKGADGTMSFEDLTPEQKATLKGDQGVQGDKGDRGVDGVQGEMGYQGDRGEKGYQGDAGVQGAKGDSTGVVGPQGPQGDRGADGVQGEMGYQGDRGEKGYQGDAGVQGAKGDSSGVVGPQGTQGTQGDKGDRGPQGYGSSSPAAELPKVFIKNWDGDMNNVNFNLSILYNNKVFDNLEAFFESICGTTEQIDADVWANDENYPNPERFSTNKAFAILIDGDFDILQLMSNNFNTLHLQRIPTGLTSGTQKMPTWLTITISAKASLFNLKNKQYTINGIFNTKPISDTDYISILGYTYIDLSRAQWNNQNTTL